MCAKCRDVIPTELGFYIVETDDISAKPMEFLIHVQGCRKGDAPVYVNFKTRCEETESSRVFNRFAQWRKVDLNTALLKAKEQY